MMGESNFKGLVEFQCHCSFSADSWQSVQLAIKVPDSGWPRVLPMAWSHVLFRALPHISLSPLASWFPSPHKTMQRNGNKWSWEFNLNSQSPSLIIFNQDGNSNIYYILVLMILRTYPGSQSFLTRTLETSMWNAYQGPCNLHLLLT